MCSYNKVAKTLEEIRNLISPREEDHKLIDLSCKVHESAMQRASYNNDEAGIRSSMIADIMSLLELYERDNQKLLKHLKQMLDEINRKSSTEDKSNEALQQKVRELTTTLMKHLERATGIVRNPRGAEPSREGTEYVSEKGIRRKELLREPNRALKDIRTLQDTEYRSRTQLNKLLKANGDIYRIYNSLIDAANSRNPKEVVSHLQKVKETCQNATNALRA